MERYDLLNAEKKKKTTVVDRQLSTEGCFCGDDISTAGAILQAKARKFREGRGG